MVVPIQLRRDTLANWKFQTTPMGEGEFVIELDSNRRKLGDGSKAYTDLDFLNVSKLPSKQGNIFSLRGLRSYINKLAVGSNFVPEIIAYTHGISGVVKWAYSGACYSPVQNRIYLIPHYWGTAPTWHYIDCATGAVVAYTHGATCVNIAYYGGVYSPKQNRIYLVPFNQATAVVWHYIDCATGAVVAYTHGATCPAMAYYGGVYSPKQNRIYLVPAYQPAYPATAVVWHYIDCATGLVVAYTHGIAAVIAYPYRGGCYSPSQNRIYLIPYAQCTATVWHYIDCNNGSVVEYTHNTNITATYAFTGGVYSPTNNRIYLISNGTFSTTATTWYYIDCNNGSVVGYSAYTQYGSSFGVYAPMQDRIYLAPATGTVETWNYIDCESGSMVLYSHNVSFSLVSNPWYMGGIYSPTQNRVYFIPYNMMTISEWHYIDCDTGNNVYPSKWLMAGPMFNKL